MYRSLKGIITIGTAAILAVTFAEPAFAQRTKTASKPSASKPAASEPAAARPTASEPAASKPAASEPAASKPAASKPAAKAPAAAERANKWVFGAHTIATPGVSITGPDFNEWPVNTTMGGGIGVMAGYELNRAVTAFASLDLARQSSGVNWMQGSFGLVHAELGVRAKLSQKNTQMVPYLTAAVGRRALGARILDLEDDETYDLSFSGTMLSFGGGLQYALSPKIALDGGVELGVGTFDHYDSDGEIGSLSANASTSIRVKAGFVWRP